MIDFEQISKKAEEAVLAQPEILDCLGLSKKDRELALLLAQELNRALFVTSLHLLLTADSPSEVMMAATASLLSRMQAAFAAVRKAGADL